WAEEHGPFRLSDLDPRRLAAAGRQQFAEVTGDLRGGLRPRPELPRMSGLRLNRRRTRA
ncbi:MAG: hypothetical protein QOH38_1802, partial [Thermoleophilaceae bacterium]|nr:hypothetical protein [Thermoleophilaceae bacterium]